MDFDKFCEITKNASAIRTRNRLQPAGGPGDVVYPPTYLEGPTRHERIIEGERVPCVLLDSIASQANRIEEALRDADLKLPTLVVNVGDERITSWDVPHRFCDAILRSCTLNGTPYLKSDLGDALLNHDLARIFGYSPASLLLGMWHSNRKGGPGLKIPRALSSEIVAVDVADAPHVASRVDPLPFSKSSKLNETDPDKSGYEWELSAKGKAKPSDCLLGNIPPSTSDGRGITMRYAEQTTVISLTTIRRLRIGNPEQRMIAHAVLTALGIAGTVLASENGWLRSRCHLLPETEWSWESIRGHEVESLGVISSDEAKSLLNESIERAKTADLPWQGEIELMPSEQLEKLVGEGRDALGGGE